MDSWINIFVSRSSVDTLSLTSLWCFHTDQHRLSTKMFNGCNGTMQNCFYCSEPHANTDPHWVLYPFYWCRSRSLTAWTATCTPTNATKPQIWRRCSGVFTLAYSGTGTRTGIGTSTIGNNESRSLCNVKCYSLHHKIHFFQSQCQCPADRQCEYAIMAHSHKPEPRPGQGLGTNGLYENYVKLSHYT